MNIKDFQEEWKKDAKIDYTKIDLESLRISELHSKYLNLLSSERIKYKRCLDKKKAVETKLTDYYGGIIDGPDIGRPPFQLKLSTSSQINKRVETDKEFIDINLQLALFEEGILFLKEVLSAVNQRSFNIRNYIEWMKFTGGQL